MKGDILKRALLASPVSGKPALLFGVAAVAVPSLVRALLFHLVSAGAFLTYVPFVLLSAIILKPRDAALVALASAIAADFFFMPPHFGFTATADGLFGIAMLVIIAGMAVCIAIGIRNFARNALSPASNEVGGVIFSERGGEAWANWEGDRPPVKLGPHKDVAEMMEDYIAQVELGERLNKASRKPEP